MRFIQVSDTHLFADKKATLLGVNTRESLKAVMSLLTAYEDEYDFIIHSGDLSQDCSIESYERVIHYFNQLGKPVYCIPGNHDDPAIMSSLFPSGQWLSAKQIITQYWQLILLNSHHDGSVAGFLSDTELQYLEACLMAHPDKHALVFLHHQPVNVHSAWLDQVGLLNKEALWSVINRYLHVRAICFGHVHQEFFCVENNIQCYATPSTCIQFKRNQDQFGLEFLPPGFRLVSLHPQGEVNTCVIRLDHYIGKFEVDATGY